MPDARQRLSAWNRIHDTRKDTELPTAAEHDGLAQHNKTPSSNSHNFWQNLKFIALEFRGAKARKSHN